VNRKYLRGSKGNSTVKDGEENNRNLDRVTTCTLSGKELTEPIVCCKLGYLYNKEEIYQRLLDKSLKYDDEYKHIRKIKDLINCQMTPNPVYKDNNNVSKSKAEAGAKFICPITLVEMNGKYPFVILPKSGKGKVISLKATQEANLGLLKQGESYLQLFPTPAEAKRRREEIINKRKAKKHKRSAGSDEEKAHKKCKVKVGSTINEAISIKAKQMIAKAHDKVSKAKQDSDTYKKLFAVEEEDATEDGKDKNRLFMIGNPRGYVRC